MGRGRLPPPGSGSHSCGLFSPPKLASAEAATLAWQGPLLHPLSVPWAAAAGWGSQDSPLFLFRGTGSVAFGRPPHPAPRPLGLSGPAQTLPAVSHLQRPSACVLALSRRGHSPGARPQRLRGLGLRCGRGSRWAPWAEPTGAGSSSTWLVLLALPPRAAQGERSCWGLAGALWNRLRPLTAPRPGEAPGPRAPLRPGRGPRLSLGPGQGGCAVLASTVAALSASATSLRGPGRDAPVTMGSPACPWHPQGAEGHLILLTVARQVWGRGAAAHLG